jgi:hypothetical protein
LNWRETTADLAAASPVRLGTHNDWVAVGDVDWRGIVSLAADGSLWHWWNRNPVDRWDTDQPMLENSRRPEFIENIFAREK